MTTGSASRYVVHAAICVGSVRLGHGAGRNGTPDFGEIREDRYQTLHRDSRFTAVGTILDRLVHNVL